jgi:uncharacterized protein
MRFEWDENKSRANRAKHRVSFETATRVFFDPAVVLKSGGVVGQEQRWNAIGMAANLMILVVCHTHRGKDGEEVIRIISARKASSHEEKEYYSQFGS